MQPGTTVYLNWYDFAKKSEHLCKGEVVENSDWEGTQWQGYVNVRFQPPGMKTTICHHFKADKLSLDQSAVPHDDCTLICAKRMPVNTHTASASDAWKHVQQFKQDHWDYQHGHISTDALDEYYQLWHDAIAAKRGYREITQPYSAITRPYQEITQPYSAITRPYQEITQGYHLQPPSVPSADVPRQPQQPKEKTQNKPKPTNITELSLF